MTLIINVFGIKFLTMLYFSYYKTANVNNIIAIHCFINLKRIHFLFVNKTANVAFINKFISA